MPPEEVERLLTQVRDATRDAHELREVANAAYARRRAALKAAMDAGLKPRDVADAAGFSATQQIYQTLNSHDSR